MPRIRFCTEFENASARRRRHRPYLSRQSKASIWSASNPVP